jgi:isopentenyl diphosphate isomerase/L-lactate dehydrogenase-like FMN-dependent dehydrogenase
MGARLSSRPINVWDYERLAEDRLEPGILGYISGGAADEHTLRDNCAAFRRWRLRPRVLVDVGAISTETEVLGRRISMPVLVAPTAYQALVHPEGESAMARGAAAAGTIFCLSTLASVRPAELAGDAPDGPRWFQLYWSSDREFTRELVAEAVDSRFEALVLTVDLPYAGRRERDLRTSFRLPETLRLPNLSPNLERPADPGAGLGPVVDETLTWRDLEWLAGISPLPLVIKGVLTREDALLACEHGAAAVVVSNHGGRQLDGVPAALDALPEVLEAVGDRAEVLMDSGIRRGTDVLVALALGARAVLVGRACLWALAANGSDGVAHMLHLLREEIALGLALLGAPSPHDVRRDHVAPVGS